MDWRGLVKSVNPDDLPEGASPDTSNASLYQGKKGLLGPRAGKTFFNSSAYSGAVKGVLPFRLGNLNRWLNMLTDGTGSEINASLATWTAPSRSRKIYYSKLSSPMSDTCDYNEGTTEVTSALEQTITSPPANAILLFEMPAFTWSVTVGPTASDGEVSYSCYLGVRSGGTNYYSATPQLLITNTDIAGQRSGTAGANPLIFIPTDAYEENALSADITDVCMKLVATADADVTGGSFTVGPINSVLVM